MEDTTPPGPATPCMKQRLTFARARDAAKKHRRRHGDNSQHYWCRDCQAWHIGTRPKRKRRGMRTVR